MAAFHVYQSIVFNVYFMEAFVPPPKTCMSPLCKSSTGHSTVINMASGDSKIDGLLTRHHWGDATVLYSVPTVDEYIGVYGQAKADDFFALTATMQAVASFALDTAYGNAPNDGFSIGSFTNARVRIAQTTLDPYNYNTAWAYYPATGKTGGDA